MTHLDHGERVDRMATVRGATPEGDPPPYSEQALQWCNGYIVDLADADGQLITADAIYIYKARDSNGLSKNS